MKREKSREGDDEEWIGNVTIAQNWSEIVVSIDAPNSFSNSVVAAIKTKGSAGRPELFYEYYNEPKSGAPEDDFPHHGVGKFRLNDQSRPTIGEGEYYNNPRYRQNHGRVIIAKNPTEQDNIRHIRRICNFISPQQ